MLEAHGYAAAEARARLAPFRFQRRDALAHDVVLELLYCGICHSDLHYVNNDWGFTRYPVVPGHEIVGRVVAVGKEVGKFKPATWQRLAVSWTPAANARPVRWARSN